MVFISSHTHTNTNTLKVSVEGVWSLGGEARFVLATQDPVGEGELDLRVLQREKKNIVRFWSKSIGSLIDWRSTDHLLPVSEPPGEQMEAGTRKRKLAFIVAGL